MLYSCVAVLCIALAGCSSQNTPTGRRYHLKGTVISLDRRQKSIVVDHEAIPGFMAAMTMPYPVMDNKVFDEVNPGDQITADVVVTDQDTHLENVVVVKKGEGRKSASNTGYQQPGTGDAVPDFALVNQAGKRIDLRQYQGKAVLLTFIYTRCPLPDYCPLMTHNFADIEKDLANRPEIFARTHLLSISFDPKYDTPEVLRAYARYYVPDRGKDTFDHWEFATILPAERKDISQFFNLFYSEQEDQIVHSMSTAIISPDGRLYRWYSGNDWKPKDVEADLVAAVPRETAASAGGGPAASR